MGLGVKCCKAQESNIDQAPSNRISKKQKKSIMMMNTSVISRNTMEGLPSADEPKSPMSAGH